MVIELIADGAAVATRINGELYRSALSARRVKPVHCFIVRCEVVSVHVAEIEGIERVVAAEE